MELLIWAGGRWRRVCSSSGRVTGWRRRARVFFKRRNVLRELPPLPALASIIKGPALPKKRLPSVDIKPKVQKDASVQTDTESILNGNSKQNSRTKTSPEKSWKPQCNKENGIFAVPRPKDTIHFTMVSKSMKNIQMSHKNQTILRDNNSNKRARERDFRSASTEIIELRPNKIQQDIIHNKVNLDLDENRSNNKVNVTNTETEAKQREREYKDRDDTQTSSEEEGYKEIIINEDDVLVLRRYIETHNTNIDLYRFDADDKYKTIVFFKINPLVRLKRCPRIAQMLKDHDSHATIYFAKQLGLRSIDSIESDVDKSNRRIKHRKAKEAKRTADTETDEEPLMKRRRIVEETTDADVQSVISDKENRHRLRKKNKKAVSVDIHRRNDDSDTNKSNQNKKDNKNQDSSTDIDKIIERKANKFVKDVETKLNKERKELTEREANGDNEQARKSKKHKEITIVSNSSDEFDKRKVRTDKENKQDKRTESDVKTSEIDVKKRKFEQAFTKKSQNKTNKDVQKNVSDEENQRPKDRTKIILKRRIAVPKRSSVPPGREYTPKEDQSIVAWISTSSQRERTVNGNKVWRQLEEVYTRITGQKRSWHSLRNRYLRYILPSLESLHLPAEQTLSLRANAATGELKSRKRSRNNSVFRLPAVRSAFTRVPRPKLHDNSDLERSQATSPDRRLRSSTIGLITKLSNTQSSNKTTNHTQSQNKTNNHTQSQNKTTNRMQSPNKKTANRSQSPNNPDNVTQSSHKSPNRELSPNKKAASRTQSRNKTTNRTQSPNKSSNRTQSPSKAGNQSANSTQSPSKRVTRQSRSPRSSPSYSELTRRFALRNRSTPHDSPIPVKEHHKRRLYNPQQLASATSSPTT